MDEKAIRARVRGVLKGYRLKMRQGDIEETAAIEQALYLLSDKYQEILRSKYMQKEPETYVDMSFRFGCSYKTIEYWMSIATLQFAEAYRNGALLNENEKA